jgi:uncharacterized protein
MVTQAVDLPPLPALVVGKIHHIRHTPFRHKFKYRDYHWLVDLDDLPRYRRPLRWISRFDERDHMDRGRLGGGTRGDIERFLANRGVTLRAADRVIMFAHPRVLGYVFNPMSAFWCLTPEGSIRAIVFEVHNTYGDRHAYLLNPDDKGRVTVDKDFYVSPFNKPQGVYTMRVRLDPKVVSIAIRLDQDGERVLDATVAGKPKPATPRALAGTFAWLSLMPQRGTFFIRVHGIWLWIRRLPVISRPKHSPEAVR